MKSRTLLAAMSLFLVLGTNPVAAQKQIHYTVPDVGTLRAERLASSLELTTKAVVGFSLLNLPKDI
jgi:hypothetical protein